VGISEGAAVVGAGVGTGVGVGTSGTVGAGLSGSALLLSSSEDLLLRETMTPTRTPIRI
jgi:hypothetical protein